MLTYFGAFWVVEKGLSVSGSGLMMMIGGTGYFAGSLAAGGRLGRFDQRLLFASRRSSRSRCWAWSTPCR